EEQETRYAEQVCRALGRYSVEGNMKRSQQPIFFALGVLLAIASISMADTVTLKDGRQLSGVIQSGAVRVLLIQTSDGVQSVVLAQIQSISFGTRVATLERRSKRWDIGVADLVRCGIASNDRSL